MYTYLNMSSLIFGVIALSIPLAGMIFKKMFSRKTTLIVSFVSFSCLIAACMLYHLHMNQLINMAEWDQLKERQDIEFMVSMGLSALTVALNGLFLYKCSDYIGIKNKKSYD